ncbi:MAG: lytic transglycosylase [Bacteroides sp. 43_108]|nr:MAG: lytic transglycosylase [Bacteroides sp. 43_108]
MKKRIAILFMSACLFGGAMAQNTIEVRNDKTGEIEAFDMPDGMTTDADTILSEYGVANGLSEGHEVVEDLPYNDSILIQRLSRIPTNIEMPINNVTRKFIDKYCMDLRNSVAVMLGNINFYVPIFEEALEMYGVPLELKYLPVIESALRPTAVSRVGAAGLWQFMVPTAKRYGLEVNTLVDERRDPVKSSYAAAKYLRDLYNRFGDWGLAIAAYNCGEGNVDKAIARSSKDSLHTDYWTVYAYLPRETRGYVPAFIAANYIMNYYCKHGIRPMEAHLPMETDTVVVSKEVHLDQIAHGCGVTVEQLRALNPQYRHDIVPADYALRLPQAYIEKFIMNEDSIYAMKLDNVQMRRSVTADVSETVYNQKHSTKKSSRTRTKTVKVRKGDTLSEIAKRNGTTVSKLRRLNGIRGTMIRPGQRIRVR